jgi:hypothetical protein
LKQRHGSKSGLNANTKTVPESRVGSAKKTPQAKMDAIVPLVRRPKADDGLHGCNLQKLNPQPNRGKHDYKKMD